MIGASIPKTLAASFLMLTLMFCIANSNLEAQVTGATISGTAVETTCRLIANARVVVTNTATSISRSVTSNADGFYTMANLLAGSYEVTFSASGFKTDVRKGVALTVGQAATLDLTMEVGAAIETV